ncbi:MAG TPA: YcxB family protein [Campylobacterales bacterium]|nr:YcxB family protein [Campylobacterales bacterium]
MKIEYTLSLEEYLEAVKLHQKMGFRKLMMAIYIVVAVMIIVISTDYSDTREIFRNYGALFFAISFYLLLTKMIGTYQSKKLYQKSKTLSKETVLRVSAKGIRVADNQKPIPWDTFTKYKEDDKYVILYTSIVNFKIIPKSAMSPMVLKEFMALVQEHIVMKAV